MYSLLADSILPCEYSPFYFFIPLLMKLKISFFLWLKC